MLSCPPSLSCHISPQYLSCNYVLDAILEHLKPRIINFLNSAKSVSANWGNWGYRTRKVVVLGEGPRGRHSWGSIYLGVPRAEHRQTCEAAATTSSSVAASPSVSLRLTTCLPPDHQLRLCHRLTRSSPPFSTPFIYITLSAPRVCCGWGGGARS